MNQKDLNRLSMWKTVYAVLQSNDAIWQDNKAFSGAADGLKTSMYEADAAARQQSAGTTTGITMDKNNLADAAIAATLSVTRLARAYARKAGNQTLLAAVDYDKSRLESTPLDELEARLQSMVDAATGVKEALKDYGFKEGADTAATAAIRAFHDAAPNTRVAIAGRSSVTKSVPEIMRAGKGELLVLDDLIHLYDDDEPGFVGTYKAARVIVDAGSRGTKGKDVPMA